MPSSRRSSRSRVKVESLKSPALAGRFFITNAIWEAIYNLFGLKIFRNALIL